MFRRLAILLVVVLVLRPGVAHVQHVRAQTLPPSQDQLQAALLTVDDLPPGWAAVQPGSGSTSDTACGTTAFSQQSTAAVEADFQRGQLGPSLAETIDAFPPGEGQPVFDGIAAAASACQSFPITVADGTMVTAYLAPDVSFATLGHESAAYTLTVTGAPVPIAGEFVLIRVGDNIITLSIAQAGIATDAIALQSIAMIAENKLAMASSSVCTIPI